MVKKPKDVNAPKRPLSAYFAWQKDNRSRVVKSMAVGYSLGELAKALGKAYAEADPAVKKQYEDKNKKEMETWKKLNNAYKQTANYAAYQTLLKEHSVKAVQKTKFRKDENAPKRPMSAYFLWMNDKRQSVLDANPGMKHKEALSKLAEMWKDVTDEEKKPYQDKAALAKKNYAVELEKYKNTDAFKTYQSERADFNANRGAQLKKAKKRARGEDDAPKPKKKAKKAKKKSPKKKGKKSKKKPKAPKKKSVSE